MLRQPSARAQVITRRSYNRPVNDEGTLFETFADTIDRVISHQKWLWERARHRKLNTFQEQELEELRQLMMGRYSLPSGRTMWLGGTEIAKRREASQFNCAFANIETIHDVVDALWLLLQGCGVGFSPVVGTLNGFTKPIKQIEVISSTRADKGRPTNLETFSDGVWTIGVGDSAEAWAKAVGKLVAGKYAANKLVLDFSEIRPSGTRLKGYGWISSGDKAIAAAFVAICGILNRRAGRLLSKMDILDIVNWLGTVLSSRRSSEIALFDFMGDQWEEFAFAKKEFWLHGNDHRQQSNNSLMFWQKPTRGQIADIFDMMQQAGGSEPGMINAAAATARAPWFSGVNPCAEILLPNKGFCNLVETDVSKFSDDPSGLLRAIQLIGRANYRQTCVDLEDGILQSAWHENNEFLRLCGVGLTGIIARPDLTAYDYRQIRNAAAHATYSMADELGLPRPKNIGTIKPSGTMSKIMDCPEGLHKPMGRFIFNNVKFSVHDPVVRVLESAGYKVFESPNPTDVDTVIACFPVKWDGVPFTRVNGTEVNVESAVSQLERYKMLMDNYVDHNASITVSYDPGEIPEIVDWIDRNWDTYVGVSFLHRTDPTKTAKDLGYPYLPQEVTTEEAYLEYVSKLQPVVIDQMGSSETMLDDDCAGGACPIR